MLSIFHPVTLFFLETTLTACIIAGTSSTSRIRPIGLLPVIGCVFAIVMTSASHMRLPWASLLSGSSIGFLLQYIDIAILNKLSFTPNTGNGDKAAQTTLELNPLIRLLWGFRSTFTFRYVNTPMEVKNVPKFHCGVGHFVKPSRGVFVTKSFMTAIVCYLILDFFSLQPPPESLDTLFSWQVVTLLGRTRHITASELTFRAITSIFYWINMFCVMQGITSLAGGIAVAFGWTGTDSWRPLFGSILDAYSLRNFWGMFWHQTLRHILSEPATYLTQEMLVIPREWLIYRYTHLSFVFFISGLLHWFAELGGGMPLGASGTVRFFVTQILGIILEDAAVFLYLSRIQRSRKAPTIISLKAIGYIWVLMFIVWSTPAWLYPIALRPVDAPIVPFSIIGKLLSLQLQ